MPRRHRTLVVRFLTLRVAFATVIAARQATLARRGILGILGVLGPLLAVREGATHDLRAGDVRDVRVLGEEGRDEGGWMQLAFPEGLELLLVH